MRQTIFDEAQTDLAMSFNNVAEVNLKLGLLQQPLEKHQRLLEMCQYLFERDHPAVACSLYNVGGVYYHLAQDYRALSFYRRAQAMEKALLGADHPYLVDTRQVVEKRRRELAKQTSWGAKLLPPGRPFWLRAAMAPGCVYSSGWGRRVALVVSDSVHV